MSIFLIRSFFFQIMIQRFKPTTKRALKNMLLHHLSLQNIRINSSDIEPILKNCLESDKRSFSNLLSSIKFYRSSISQPESKLEPHNFQEMDDSIAFFHLLGKIMHKRRSASENEPFALPNGLLPFQEIFKRHKCRQELDLVCKIANDFSFNEISESVFQNYLHFHTDIDPAQKLIENLSTSDLLNASWDVCNCFDTII